VLNTNLYHDHFFCYTLCNVLGIRGVRGGVEEVQRGWEELQKLILERKTIIFPEIFYLVICLVAFWISAPSNIVYKPQSSACMSSPKQLQIFYKIIRKNYKKLIKMGKGLWLKWYKAWLIGMQLSVQTLAWLKKINRKEGLAMKTQSVYLV
jgi:hypothetical protein